MSEHSRREFLGFTLPAGLALGAGLTALRSSTFAAQNQTPTPAAIRGGGANAAARFALELDGHHAGWLDSVEGGDATADVVLEKMGPDNIQHKHLAGVKYEDIVLTCGTGMSKDFYDWIKASLDRRSVVKNGAIVALDFSGKPVSRLEWTNGLLTEVALPACDAASKDIARMTLKITPALTKMAPPQAGGSSVLLQQKKWLPSNFRLQIAGCQSACSHVSAVDAIVLKYAQLASAPGVLRSVQLPGRQVEVPNLCLMAAESEATEFLTWYEDFLIKGNNAPAGEKTGTLEYLTPDMKQPLFTLSFGGLGIFKFAPDKMQVGMQAIRRVRAEMYCDSIAFNYSA